MRTLTKREAHAIFSSYAENLLLLGVLDDSDSDDDVMDWGIDEEDEDEERDDWLEEEEGEDWGDLNADADEFLLLHGLSWQQVADSFAAGGPRGSYDRIPKSSDFFTVCLRAPDRWFRHMFRLGRETFIGIIKLIADDPVFISRGRRPQRPVIYQLGTFIVRYGLRGSDSLDTAMKMSIGHGTVSLYCKRVQRALRRLRDRVAGWPNDERKDVISEHIEEKTGFPGCLGSGDGSLVRFSEQPEAYGPMYRCRKKFFGTNIQATVDHEFRFTSYDIGWPGAVTDAKIWKNSHLYRERHAYFRNGEYIMVDKGYPSSPWALRPFNEDEISPECEAMQRRMRRFNKLLSNVRVASEQAFGLLKGRFPSLKEMGSHSSVQDIYRIIEALIIVHNICIDLGDSPRWIWNYDPLDDFDALPLEPDEDIDADVALPELGGPVRQHADVPAHETDAWLREKGREKRMALFEVLCPE